ncbi:NAD(P)-dependent oxidoreductase [Conexibacter woesei]|uniref:6-phosphogluconate dehydrogenase NAD-binding protein n=1 Tax=Conexibacter woesei (strain DSM 14684 / CCUG 47730 / CIP 108061 / JCM 11494 / NBRC 100937 / ID131577) TaxID=469383 RepID=D3FEZ8_CONWI|nr:NAD(P)-dependent oxidoreductase [Conexibacter woesei]ADB51715.1 6-phosphogluconate dehydrogenase NAD-binding protein [Conexibacter woesei DSM 14684]
MERIGFIGLGIMGSRMAANLRRAGHPVTVWNRTRARAEAWAAEHGGTVAATPAEVAAASDVVITIVVDGTQVEQVLLGEDGVVEDARPGLLCIDMSTIAPDESRQIAARLAERGVAFVDAPVTGSSPKAEDGTLTIMVGGAEADVARARPVLERMGEKIVHVGPVGQGETVKVLCNAVAATNAATLAQALLVGKRAGVDLERMVDVLKASSAGSAMADLKAGPMLAHDFTTLFKLEHMLKDVRYALDAGEAAGAPFPFAAATRELLSAGVGRGLGEQDFAAVLEVLEGLAGARLDD